MSNHHQNNIISVIFLTLIGTGLYLLLNYQPAPQKKSYFHMKTPAEYKQREYVHNQAILRLAPHMPGGSIISLN